jgi:LmbE family N-acetylglucosaminyl deacetylase
MSDVAALGTILGVWAHPDDEAYLSGGLMAMATDAGARVVCVTATRGELGTADPRRWPPALLAEERTAELTRCLAILGVTEHRWLDYPDGGCAAVPEDAAVARLGELIDDVRPDTVVTFGPHGQTGHPDHRAVSSWTAEAFRRAARPGARLLCTAIPEWWAARWGELHERLTIFEPGYPETVPDDALTVHLALDGPTVARKVRALAAQETQTAALIDLMGRDAYAAWVSHESFVDG